MERYTCFGAALLLLLVAYADAACVNVENPQELLEYSCEGGTVEDLKQIPDNVEKIRISHMPVGRISETMFARFGRSLRVLTCSHCMITDIDDRAFRRLENLEQLSLDNNHLKEVKGAWFEGLAYLTYLDFNYNAIERIDGDVFRNAPDLVDVRISGNRLACLDVDAMARLSNLKRIFVNENPQFACPNAVKKFLSERNISYEADPHWETIQQDYIQANTPAPVPPVQQEIRDKYVPMTTPPAYYTRPHYTEPTSPPEMTTPPPPPPPPTIPPSPPVRPRPYVPEMIQTSVPSQDGFVYQSPHIAPSVTQQQLDNYRNQAQQAARNVTDDLRNKTVVMVANATQLMGQETTTECPNAAAGLSRDSTLAAGLMLAAILSACRWTVNEA